MWCVRKQSDKEVEENNLNIQAENGEISHNINMQPSQGQTGNQWQQQDLSLGVLRTVQILSTKNIFPCLTIYNVQRAYVTYFITYHGALTILSVLPTVYPA